MKTVKFAVLGCGKTGIRHISSLENIENAQIEAVYDADEIKVKKLGRQHGCKYYSKIDDLLKDTEIDFVNICTPSGLHAKHTIQSLNAGKNVLCEKPMALKESDALAMVKTAEKNKKLLFVVKQNRYNPPVKLLTHLINEGKLGKPLMCVVNMFWNRNEEYYKSNSWRGTLQFDGGTIFTQTSHFVDLMLMFMGRPRSLCAYMGTQKHEIEIEDTGVVVVGFENGAYGSLNYTTCATKKSFEGSITLIFEEGTVKIGGEYLNTIDYFQVNGVDSYELGDTVPSYSQLFKDIIKVANNPKDTGRLLFGEKAVDVVRFMEKSVKSARKNEKISF